jgi:hypothetical protein
MYEFIKHFFSSKKIQNTEVKDKDNHVDNCEDNCEDNYEWAFDYSYYDEQEIIQISEKICKNIQNMNDPTFDEIDEILITANYLLENDKIAYENLILKCPNKFMMTYSNNSERTPHIIKYVNTFNPTLANKILEYTNNTHKNTWSERNK